MCQTLKLDSQITWVKMSVCGYIYIVLILIFWQLALIQLGFCGCAHNFSPYCKLYLQDLKYSTWVSTFDWFKEESMHAVWSTANCVHWTLWRIVSWTSLCIACPELLCQLKIVSGEAQCEETSTSYTTVPTVGVRAVTSTALLGDMAIANWKKKGKMITCMWMWVSLCVS